MTATTVKKPATKKASTPRTRNPRQSKPKAEQEQVVAPPAEETKPETKPATKTTAKKEKAPKDWKTKPRLLPGLHRTVWNPVRKTWVSVYDGKVTKEAKKDGRWVVKCETHEAVKNVETAKLGREAAHGDPADFCDACKA